ncbi:MAG: dephospho-CoA kinase [Flavobacteriales bacterium]|nr:dephospho-CoA kinase [Flavobacteriales bacterium]
MSREKEKIKLGLTGGIGSGKTFVGAIFSKLGIPVFNADDQARKCMSENESLKNDIQNMFGDHVYHNGSLQNKVLADIVFNNNQKLEELNKLVHPVVRQRFDSWSVEQNSRIIIKEAAILFESNSHVYLDKLICVSAHEQSRIERVIKRDNTSREQVLRRIEIQMPQNEKEKLSDFVIINDEVELLLPQIIKIIDQIS